MDELERVIYEASNNKAEGEDRIPYEFLKRLGPKAKEMVLHRFNKCWSGEGIPTKWRTAIIMPLLKDGKDPKGDNIIPPDISNIELTQNARKSNC